MTKRKRIALAVLLIVLFSSAFIRRYYAPVQKAHRMMQMITDSIKDGDLVFQTSLSAQSKAIQEVTHSPYSHCGLIFKENGSWSVLEAVQPVKSTPLERWIARGKDGHFVIKRLKNADKVLTEEAIYRMKREAEHFKGRNYDIYFSWTNERIYCSELIWKVYQRATGIRIGQLQQLKDFDLRGADVQAIMKKRYGNDIPWNDTVISPANMFSSPLLIPVAEH